MNKTIFPIWLAHDATGAPGERRRARRAAPHVTAEGLRVEALGFEVMQLHRQAWLDLAGRALESNVFLDPDFALAAAQHAPPARRPRFAVARGVVDGRMRIVGLCPLAPGRPMLAAPARVWTHDYASLGAPLLDADKAEAAMEAIAGFVAREAPGAGALLLPKLAEDGPVMQLLRDRAAAGGTRLRSFDAHRRAALRCGPGAAGARVTGEHRRQRRRLAEQGRVDFTLVEDAAAVRDGLESFLALETLGWKGAAGTALLQDGRAATFARAGLRQMARRGRVRIATLSLDGAPIAQGVVLVEGARLAFWKIAFDPAYARYSPGVLLTLELSAQLAADPQARLVDSCAIGNHPMIDRLWPERLGFADVVIALPQARRAFAAATLREDLRRRLRGLAKRAYYRVSRRKAS